MKEILVTKLDKEDLARVKEFNKRKTVIDNLICEARSQVDAFWRGLKVKHNLGAGEHYIKGNAIYKQEL